MSLEHRALSDSKSSVLTAHSSQQNNMWTKSVDCCPLSVDIKKIVDKVC